MRCSVTIWRSALFSFTRSVSFTRPASTCRPRKIAIVLFMPAVHITLLGKLKRPRILQCHPGAFADFLAEPVHALLGDHILQARMLAISAVAEIAVHRQHCLGHFNEMFRLEESNHIRHARVGLLIVMAHAHTPPAVRL